uniref:Uncharacterized protein n=1 Tax=Triticum urartu TaxID=4572 RepID=A0A8R7V6A2_TRIUA
MRRCSTTLQLRGEDEGSWLTQVVINSLFCASERNVWSKDGMCHFFSSLLSNLLHIQ